MANEKRLIAVNDVYSLFDQSGRATLHVADIDVIPRVDAVPVVHGRNLDADTPSLFECSVCHWSCIDTYYGDTEDYNYCPNCGAKMDGWNEDENS